MRNPPLAEPELAPGGGILKPPFEMGVANFIKDNFDVDENRYSVTIIFLKSVQLVLNNGSADKPTKEDAHIIIDVIHEIADIHARNESEKKLNEEIAVSLNLLIETLK